jgi:hypothetical protein
MQDTAPVGAVVGSMWWNSISGQLYVYYNDGTSTQWVSASGTAAGAVLGKTAVNGTPGSVLFVDGSHNVAQDNANLFWDDATYDFKIGHSTGPSTTGYFISGLRSLYLVPNASGNNWFEGNAGNTSLTGTGNLGTGDLVLASVTSGSGNMGVGGIASGALITTLGSVTVGSNNVGIGASALASNTGGNSNFAVGTKAMFYADTGCDYNTALGNQALVNLGVGGRTGTQNIAVGYFAGQVYGGDYNVMLGSQTGPAGFSGAAQYNTFIGAFCGQNWDPGVSNTLIGQKAGSLITSGSHNLLLGSWQGPSTAMDDVIGFSTGRSYLMLDYNWTGGYRSSVWSMNPNFLDGKPTGLHIYNVADTGYPQPATNYERAILDWNPTANVFRIGSQAAGTGVVRLIAIDAFSKAGAPASTDLPTGACAFIDDTTNNQTWLCFNKAGTVRKVQLV